MRFVWILLLICLFLVSERILHNRRLRRIPIRIHVNGTRGKSTVTRQIAAMLREAGIRTLAKTTGDRAVLIYPDGREESFSRRGPSRIHEQIKFIRKAARIRAEAIVVECMAINPFLQAVSEKSMIQSTLGVITNVRPDHFESMGRSLDEIAESLSQTIPGNGHLVTADRRYVNFFKAKAAQRKTVVHLAEAREKSSPLFPENLAISQKVCSVLGLSPAEIPDSVEDSFPLRIRADGKTIHFINAFSANDVTSARIIQQFLFRERSCPRPFIALLNNRADRPLRALSFASFLSGEREYQQVFLTGDLRWIAKRHFDKRKKTGVVPTPLKNRDPESVLREICDSVSCQEFTLVGMGNYKGAAERLSLYVEKRGDRCHSLNQSP